MIEFSRFSKHSHQSADPLSPAFLESASSQPPFVLTAWGVEWVIRV